MVSKLESNNTAIDAEKTAILNQMDALRLESESLDSAQLRNTNVIAKINNIIN